MKLTSKSEYACLALIDLARHYNEIVTIQSIAERNNIPRKFLEQILINLKQNGYIKSKRGIQGGYSLAKNPENVTIAEILRLMDGALAPVLSVSSYFYETTPIEQNAKLISLFKEIRDYISSKLEQTTLADLI